MRPSCTATAEAFGALIRSRSTGVWGLRHACPAAIAAAAVGAGGTVDPCFADAEVPVGAPPAAAGADPGSAEAAGAPGTAVALAVALEGETAGASEPQVSCLPVTGRRSFIRP